MRLLSHVMLRFEKYLALNLTARHEYIKSNGRCMNCLSHHTVENCTSHQNYFNCKERHNSISCPHTNRSRTENNYKTKKPNIQSNSMGNNNALSRMMLVTTPATNSTGNYSANVLIHEKIPADLVDVSTKMRSKNVRLGVFTVQIRNHLPNQSTYVYAF